MEKGDYGRRDRESPFSIFIFPNMHLPDFYLSGKFF